MSRFRAFVRAALGEAIWHQLRRLKILLKAVVGKEFLTTLDVSCPTRRFGNFEYGSWYLNPDALDATSVVYSFGIGEDASFDISLIETFGLLVHAFDPTPSSIEWAKQQQFSPRFVMHEYGVAAFDGNATFRPLGAAMWTTIPGQSSAQGKVAAVPVKRLQTIMKELEHSHVDVMKMDIEGGEYDVLADMVESEIRPNQILVEFHHRFHGIGAKKTKQTIQLLRSVGYLLFYVSPQNMEFSFIRNPEQ